ncbi:II/X family phage/plasmid replication protein [Collimonas sp. PA-H2]|uniref:phage/plasmid replication protein, II/X family n=1 Tax=Collimonas sp. PA-H2 TaxID=1881062 RepID=UPI000BF79C32|nr:phage/plasmid replication protein, II/X family [Collimonas sp. PA-H2]PFH10936.1 II/X family phage/plasmid replication protein [Collimonas sp. PA-H2]
MIDLFDVVININHKPFGTDRRMQKENSIIVTGKHLTKKLELYPGAALVDVTSMDNGTKIAIRCCPLKPLQGHNIFGTNNLVPLCYHMIFYVLTTLDIQFTPSQREGWKSGHFKLRDLHITNRFGVDSHDLVGSLLAHLLRNVSLKRRPSTMEKGIGIRLFGANPGATFAMYDKRKEFEDKRNHEQKYLRALLGNDSSKVEKLLLKEASSSIRLEAKFDGGWLEKRNLDSGISWTTEKVRELFLDELAQLRLGEVPSMEDVSQLIGGLKDKKLELTALAWLHGQDLSKFHGPQTLHKRRKAIMKEIGIDIKLDHPPASAPETSIAEILCPGNMQPDSPEWVDDYPALYYKGRGLPGLDAP